MSQTAHAALGELRTAQPLLVPAASAASANGARINALAAASTPTGYAVSEVTLDTGTLVREYFLPSGMVFAVTWSGPVLPDIQGALGKHFETFTAEVNRARARGVRGGPVGFERNGVVVSSTGRMGSFLGFAYLPAQVPKGVDIHELVK